MLRSVSVSPRVRFGAETPPAASKSPEGGDGPTHPPMHSKMPFFLDVGEDDTLIKGPPNLSEKAAKLDVGALDAVFSKEIIGQQEAVDAMVAKFAELAAAETKKPPMLSFPGPSGAGKSKLVDGASTIILDSMGKGADYGKSVLDYIVESSSLGQAQIDQLIEEAKTSHSQELQDNFHHLMAAPTMDGVTPLVKHIEEVSDRIAYRKKIIGSHPNEAEMMALMWHPQFNEPAQTQHADQLVKSLTSVFRFIEQGVMTTPNEVLHSWGHMGMLSLGGFLPLKHDSKGKQDALLAQYGGNYVEGRDVDQIFGTAFQFNGKHLRRRVIDKDTAITLHQGFMLVHHPKQGVLVIRNSSKVFGRNLLEHAAYYRQEPLSPEELRNYNPKTDPLLKPVLDPSLYQEYASTDGVFLYTSGSTTIPKGIVTGPPGSGLSAGEKAKKIEAYLKKPVLFKPLDDAAKAKLVKLGIKLAKDSDSPADSSKDKAVDPPVEHTKPKPIFMLGSGVMGAAIGKTAFLKAFAEKAGMPLVYKSIGAAMTPTQKPPSEPGINDRFRYLLGQLQSLLDDYQDWKLDLSRDDAHGNFVGDTPEASPGMNPFLDRMLDILPGKRPALAVFNKNYPYGPIPLQDEDGNDRTYFRLDPDHMSELLDRVGGTWNDRKYPRSDWAAFIQQALGYGDVKVVMVDAPPPNLSPVVKGDPL